MPSDRLPVHLLISAQIHRLNQAGRASYILQKGEKNSGTILLKINRLDGSCHLVNQQRNSDGDLGWMPVLKTARPDEAEADEYIMRARSRDPDLWVIEIEDPQGENPFDGSMIKID